MVIGYIWIDLEPFSSPAAHAVVSPIEEAPGQAAFPGHHRRVKGNPESLPQSATRMEKHRRSMMGYGITPATRNPPLERSGVDAFLDSLPI